MISREMPQQEAKRDLDNLDTNKLARGISLVTPPPSVIEQLLRVAGQEIPGLATLDCVMSVFKHNPDTIMCLVNRRKTEGEEKRDGPGVAAPEGFVAQLPLNEAGRAALLKGSLATDEPDLKFVCRQHERPAAVYVWCIFVSPKVAGGIALVMERLRTPQYRIADLYCRAANTKAHRFFVNLGFAGLDGKDCWSPDRLMVFRRKIQTNMQISGGGPRYDRADIDQRGHSMEVGVVHSIEQFQKVVAIRAATYIAEQDCPYAEEFDGNDFACSHLLANMDGEPAGCIRLRYFAGFAKIERLAVLPRFRKSVLAIRLIKASIELARKKGYRHLYGHAEPELVNLWRRFGFRPRRSRASYSFSNREYIEGDMALSLSNDPITQYCPPEIINRPEGAWHKPGILEGPNSLRSSPLV